MIITQAQLENAGIHVAENGPFHVVSLGHAVNRIAGDVDTDALADMVDELDEFGTPLDIDGESLNFIEILDDMGIDLYCR